jgi:hypothetical protein
MDEVGWQLQPISALVETSTTFLLAKIWWLELNDNFSQHQHLWHLPPPLLLALNMMDEVKWQLHILDSKKVVEGATSDYII